MVNQQAYAYPATAAAPMIGYPMPTGYSFNKTRSM